MLLVNCNAFARGGMRVSRLQSKMLAFKCVCVHNFTKTIRVITGLDSRTLTVNCNASTIAKITIS